MEFKNKLRTIMDQHQLSEKEIGRTFGISQDAVKRWLSGETEPHPYMQEAMWKYFEDRFK